MSSLVRPVHQSHVGPHLGETLAHAHGLSQSQLLHLSFYPEASAQLVCFEQVQLLVPFLEPSLLNKAGTNTKEAGIVLLEME